MNYQQHLEKLHTFYTELEADKEAMANPLAHGLHRYIQGIFVRSGISVATGKAHSVQMAKATVQPPQPQPQPQPIEDEAPRNLLAANTEQSVQKAKSRKK